MYMDKHCVACLNHCLHAGNSDHNSHPSCQPFPVVGSRAEAEAAAEDFFFLSFLSFGLLLCARAVTSPLAFLAVFFFFVSVTSRQSKQARHSVWMCRSLLLQRKYRSNRWMRTDRRTATLPGTNLCCSLLRQKHAISQLFF